MRLGEQDAQARLAKHDHGILSTLHEERGVHAVPAVYAVAGEFVGIPIDTVKAKSSTSLQRVRNLEADPRATLLIEHWDRDDWTQLWWVRAEMRVIAEPDDDQLELLTDRLTQRYVQYRDRPFAAVLAFEITRVVGWSA